MGQCVKTRSRAYWGEQKGWETVVNKHVRVHTRRKLLRVRGIIKDSTRRMGCQPIGTLGSSSWQ
jgi:hypothetical protein